jgi:hypothetical protein
MIITILSIFSLITCIAICIGSLVYIIHAIIYYSRSRSKQKERVIRKGEKVFVEMFWTDDRGNMTKRRDYIVLSILESLYNRNDHMLQLVGNEPDDYETQKAMGILEDDK